MLTANIAGMKTCQFDITFYAMQYPMTDAGRRESRSTAQQYEGERTFFIKGSDVFT